MLGLRNVVGADACPLLLLLCGRGWLGTILSLAAIVWCTVTSTRFFEQAMDAKSQRYLIAYPVFLQFACFALITVF